MRKIQVNTTPPYDVIVGKNILCSLPGHIKMLGDVRKICIVSDSNVFPIWGKSVITILEESGFEVNSFILPAGEASKNGENYLNILDYFAEKQITRTDLVIALGGGVVGDIAGFSAATYLRGIRYIQLPTTLLAAVDSSVGGKTAINLSSGKNLAGAFYQPSLVLCDTSFLQTLPENVFRDGCAEIIKYAVLSDSDLFSKLEQTGPAFDPEDIIIQCVCVKSLIVAEDEHDTGVRMLLNLGHTVGHGVEAASEFGISHGFGVSIGTAVITRYAAKAGLCSQTTCDRILNLLSCFCLPTQTNIPASALFHFALSDKKRSGGYVSLVIPREIGCCDITKTPLEKLEEIIVKGI